MLTVWNSKYFYGNEISKYGLENGYVDYGTLAKAFDAVLNNDIMSLTMDIGYWEQVSGFVDHSSEIESLNDSIEELQNKLDDAYTIDDEYRREDVIEELTQKIDILENDIYELENDSYEPEVFQWYIVSDSGAKILEEVNEIVYYNNELDMYLWGVTHYGTAWSYVLTDIKINMEDK